MKAFWLSALTVALVLVTCFVAIILSHVALGVGPVSTPWPRLGVGVVFFWRLHRPGTMTVPLVFVMGLAQDLVLGDIPGAGTLALVIAVLALDRMMPSLRTMPLAWRWAGFGAFAGTVFALEWVLTSAAHLSFQPLDLVLVQGAMTFLAYPLLSVAMRQVLRIGRTPRRGFQG